MRDPLLALPAEAQLAVLGWPITHSRSPQIHAAAYRVLGLDWRYGAVELDEPGLEPFLAGLNGKEPPWRGLSLTMPLKPEAHRLSSVLDPVATESGVVNTLLRLTGGGWAGFNTDVGGLAAALEHAEMNLERTIILGAGSTAVSAALAARGLGVRELSIVARRAEPAKDLAARLEGSVQARALALGDPALSASTAGATAVISTLPGTAAAGLRLPEEWIGLPLFDVAYDPWPSPLAERWRSSGGQAHSGLEMLVQQALLQVRIFVEGDPGIELEREAEVLNAMRIAADASVEE